MAQKIKLYDLKKSDWQGKIERGRKFRSKEIQTCICGCKSNHWIIGGAPGYGPRLICPCKENNPMLHKQIISVKENIKDLQNKIKELQFQLDKPEWENDLDLKEDLKEAKHNLKEFLLGFVYLNQKVKKIKSDIEGVK